MTTVGMPRLLVRRDQTQLVRRLPQGWYWKMWEAACEASVHAYAPYSKFFVGAAVMSVGGKIYSGCNIECLDYDGTHAEEAALAAMAMGDEYKVAALLCVVRRDSPSASAEPSVPCGKCRQKIMELGMAEHTVVLIGDFCGDGTYVVAKTIDELLPYAFVL